MYLRGVMLIRTSTPLRACAALALTAACSPGNEVVLCPPGSSCDGALDGGSDLGPVDVARNPGDARADAGPVVSRDVVSLRVEPAMAELAARDGSPSTRDFTVTGVRADGTTVGISNAEWSASPAPSAAGTIGPESGRFTATGLAGGRFEITVTVGRAGAPPLTATARLDVRIERELAAAGTTAPAPAEAMRFWGAPRSTEAARQVRPMYPLDQAVMPANVPPPDVQWEGGVEGDLFLVRARKPHAELRTWVRHSGAAFGYRALLDADAWRSLLETDGDAPVTLAVDRFDAARGDVVTGADVSLRIARATLSGTIYYWDLSDGRIQKLDAITAARTLAIPSPPVGPAGTPDEGSRCIACHTVSRDGRYMSAELWGGDRPSAIFDLSSASIAADPAPTLFTPGTATYLYSTFSPDSRLLVVNRGTTLRLMQRDTGAFVDGTGLPGERAAHPDWSPDGMRVAFVTNIDGTWAVDFRAGDLAVVDRVADTMFGAPRVIHRGALTPERPVDAHPSFAPDSRWVAFQHGTNSRGANTDDTAAPMGYPGRLEMVPVDNAPDAPAIALDRATGATSDSYWPNFSPFNAGGYFWLAFYSRRDYGNAQAGTRGTRRRQIWVTAVSNTPRAGEDPSSVPYWLPGQETRVDNMSAFWAPVACRTNAETCTVSAECCSGVCQRGADGMFRCETPTLRECRRAGRTCASNADCCDGLVCFANVCGASPG